MTGVRRIGGHVCWIAPVRYGMSQAEEDKRSMNYEASCIPRSVYGRLR